MIGRCQNGPSRRAWLWLLHRPAFGFAKRALSFIGFWLAALIAAALLVIAGLMFVASLGDPVTTLHPTAGPACFKAPRSV